MPDAAPVGIADNVWTYDNSAGSTYIARSGHDIVVVDPGLPQDARLLYRMLRRLGLDPAQVGLIGLTHYHADHAGAAAQVASATGAPMAIGRADAAVVAGESEETPPVLSEGERTILDRMVASGAASMAPPRFVPEIRLGRRKELLDAAVTAIHTPGHTPGSTACRLEGGRVALVGDLAIRAPDGRFAVPGLFSVAPHAAVQSLSSLLDRFAPSIIGLGHGGAIPVEEVQDRLREHEAQ